MKNHRVVLREHLGDSPSADIFEFQHVDTPGLEDNEILVRNSFLSIDPYVRNRLVKMNSYAAGVELGGVIVGETVGTVIDSRSTLVPVGATVIGFGGWQEYYAASDSDVRVLSDEFIDTPSIFLGALGMPGLTAWACLTQVAKLAADETLLVPAASGPVGLLLGQIGKLIGARCVGVVGCEERVNQLSRQDVFDAVLDRRAQDFPEQLRDACPDGIDVYVDTVGGDVLSAAIELMNLGGRIPLVGTIADYAELQNPGPVNLRPAFTRAILVKRLSVQGVLVYDFERLQPEFEQQMSAWIRSGRVRLEEEVHRGIESAPAAFLRLLAAEHSAKIVVEL